MADGWLNLVKALVRRLKPAKLKAMTDVGVQTWRDWAKGKPPGTRLLRKAADAFSEKIGQEVKTDQLLIGLAALPYRFLDRLEGLDVSNDDPADEAHRVRHEIRAIEVQEAVLADRKHALNAELDRIIGLVAEEAEQAKTG